MIPVLQKWYMNENWKREDEEDDIQRLGNKS